MTLVVPEGIVALSNGPEVDREPTDDGRVRVRFADTMSMSTYLVAFVVGRLELTEPLDVDGVPLRIVHLPGKGHLAKFALDAGEFSLRFFTDYYGIPYPDRKVDFVALPDFAQGAMENTGLSPTASRCYWSTPSTRPSPSSRTSPTWSRTSSPTSGSATS